MPKKSNAQVQALKNALKLNHLINGEILLINTKQLDLRQII